MSDLGVEAGDGGGDVRAMVDAAACDVADGACGDAGCPAGYVMTASGCDVAPPRPIAPASLGYTTSRRPRFQWELPAGVEGARLELCRERACTTVVQSVEVTGDRAIALSELDPGVWFWRLKGRIGMRTGSVASATWEFSAPGASAMNETSWGAMFDVNGDGYGDVGSSAVTSSDAGVITAGAVLAFAGESGGIATAPTNLLRLDEPERGFGFSVANAGDVDGDGYSDVAVCALAGGPTALGRVYVFYGSPAGLAARRSVIEAPLETRGYFCLVEAAGDVNRDGFADILVLDLSFFRQDTYPSSSRLFLGGTGGVRTTATAVFETVGPAAARVRNVVGGADIDGDGFADAIAVAPEEEMNTGAVYVLWGGGSGLSVAASTRVSGPDGANSTFGAWAATAGDINQDGLADLVVLSRTILPAGRGCLYAFAGTSTRRFGAPLARVCGGDSGVPAAIDAAAVLGDVTGDGRSDVAVVDGTSIRVLRGADAPGFGLQPERTLSGVAGRVFGNPGAAGDVNRDGWSDLATFDPSASAGSASRLRVLLGSSGGVTGTDTRSIELPPGSGTLWGSTFTRAAGAR